MKKPFDAPFIEEQTGLTFPAETGVFNKTVVRINPNDLIGTIISYENENGAFADVYIYQLPDGITLEDHVKELTSALETLPDHSRLVHKVRTLSKDPLPWKELPYKYTLDIHLHEEVLYSVMWVFPYRGCVIRIRSTVPKDLENAEKAASEFCNNIYESTTKHTK